MSSCAGGMSHEEVNESNGMARDGVAGAVGSVLQLVSPAAEIGDRRCDRATPPPPGCRRLESVVSHGDTATPWPVPPHDHYCRHRLRIGSEQNNSVLSSSE